MGTLTNAQSQEKLPVSAGPTAHDLTVLEHLVQGKTLEEAGVDTGFLLRVMKDPALGLVYARAREMSSYAMEEEALVRLRNAQGTKMPATELRALDLLVQQLRWSAIKRNPSVYSEKAAVNVTVPIQINTTLDMGDSAANATKEFPNIYEVTVETRRDIPINELPDDYIAELSRTPLTITGLAESSVEAAEKEKEGEAQPGVLQAVVGASNARANPRKRAHKIKKGSKEAMAARSRANALEVVEVAEGQEGAGQGTTQ